MIVHKWKFVDSSAIQAVSYDRKNKVLHVMFRQGTVYSYPRIGAHRYSRLIHAESVGKYFNEAIRPQKGESYVVSDVVDHGDGKFSTQRRLRKRVHARLRD